MVLGNKRHEIPLEISLHVAEHCTNNGLAIAQTTDFSSTTSLGLMRERHEFAEQERGLSC